MVQIYPSLYHYSQMLRHGEWYGAPALILTGQTVQATVVPTWGGKIASLIHLPTKREWLWHNPSLRTRQPVYDASFVAEFDSGGWDECFPAVSKGPYPVSPWQGVPIPDHGELWGLPWVTEIAEDDEIHLSVSGVRFPMDFQRTISFEADALVITYNLFNPTPFPFPFLWSAHPLIAVKPGMRLLVPGNPDMTQFGTGARVQPPAILPDPAERLAVKCFGRSPSEGWVAVRDGTSELRITFDPEEVPHLGLWINAGGWSGVPGAPPYYNLGLEPCIGASDDLADAIDKQRPYGLLKPGEYLEWSLHVHLTS